MEPRPPGPGQPAHLQPVRPQPVVPQPMGHLQQPGLQQQQQQPQQSHYAPGVWQNIFNQSPSGFFPAQLDVSQFPGLPQPQQPLFRPPQQLQEHQLQMQLFHQQEMERQRLLHRRDVLEAQMAESQARITSYSVERGQQPARSLTPAPRPEPPREPEQPPRPRSPSLPPPLRRESSFRRPSGGRGRRSASPRGWASEMEEEEERRARSPLRTRGRERKRSAESRSASEARSEAGSRSQPAGRPSFSSRRKWEPRRAGAEPAGVNLQSYLTNRPEGHPDDLQLASLKPYGSISKEEVTYFKNKSGDIVVLGHAEHHSTLRKASYGQILHQTCPIMPMGNLNDHSCILEPKPSTPPALLRFDKLFVHTTPRVCSEHGQACFCPPSTSDPQQAAFMPPLCLQRGYCSKDEAAVPDFNPKDKTYGNQGRFFAFSQEIRRPVMQVPSPFLCSWRWPLKNFKPANAGEQPSLRSAILYSLHSKERYQEIVRPYCTMPHSWKKEGVHPWWAEPQRGEELEQWSRRLYGSETLFRVLLPVHPAKSSHLPVFSAMVRGMRVPVLNAEGPNILGDFLAKVLFPFYGKGTGVIPCSVCLFREKKDQLEFHVYSRSQYETHFRDKHSKFIGFIGLGFSTGLGSRLYEAMILYNYCVAHSRRPGPVYKECSLLPSMDLVSAADFDFSVTYTEPFTKLLTQHGRSDLLVEEPSSEELKGFGLMEVPDHLARGPLDVHIPKPGVLPVDPLSPADSKEQKMEKMEVQTTDTVTVAVSTASVSVTVSGSTASPQTEEEAGSSEKLCDMLTEIDEFLGEKPGGQKENVSPGEGHQKTPESSEEETSGAEAPSKESKRLHKSRASSKSKEKGKTPLTPKKRKNK